MTFRRHLFTAALFLATAMPMTWLAADTFEDIGSTMSIEAGTIAQAFAGQTARVAFQLTNHGRSGLQLKAVESAAAAGSRIVGRVGPGETSLFETVGVSPDGMLDLTTSHLWIELTGLRGALEVGDTVPVRLRFATGSVKVSLHVHAPS